MYTFSLYFFLFSAHFESNKIPSLPEKNELITEKDDFQDQNSILDTVDENFDSEYKEFPKEAIGRVNDTGNQSSKENNSDAETSENSFQDQLDEEECSPWNHVCDHCDLVFDSGKSLTEHEETCSSKRLVKIFLKGKNHIF